MRDGASEASANPAWRRTRPKAILEPEKALDECSVEVFVQRIYLQEIVPYKQNQQDDSRLVKKVNKIKLKIRQQQRYIDGNATQNQSINHLYTQREHPEFEVVECDLDNIEQ